MFQKLGHFVTTRRAIILLVWIVVLIGTTVVAPQWDDVVEDGEFQFLPFDAESRVAERLFKQTFPDDFLSSSIVVVAYRESGTIDADDEQFIHERLTGQLNEVIETVDEYTVRIAEQTETENANGTTDNLTDDAQKPVVKAVVDFKHDNFGKFLVSDDRQASIVNIKLTTDFTDGRNDPIVATVEEVVASVQKHKPAGLQLEISGTSTVGRDMRRAQRDSSKSTEKWTVLLVLGLLIAIYRAPLLAIIPLITVGVATHITLKLLSLLSLAGWIGLFSGIETYVTVLVYGAGVDYCLFLIARYKEELDQGATMDEALAGSLAKVGHALTASAATVMCGIGMLIFAQFGKFQQAGFAITFGLAIVLLAALTFTPALIRVCGRWAFWPNVQSEKIKAGADWLAPTNLASRLSFSHWLQSGWEIASRLIQKRPGLIWTVSVLCMLPFAILAIGMRHNLSYGLLSELRDSEPSVRGAKAIQKHFPPGELSPVSLLVKSDTIDFADDDNKPLITELTENLLAQSEQLGLTDIRSLSSPRGRQDKSKDDAMVASSDPPKKLSLAERIAIRAGEKSAFRHLYVGETNSKVMRVDVVFVEDPFSRDAIDNLNVFRETLPTLLPAGLKDAELSYVGATPQLRDLKIVTDSDQIRIDMLVLGGVFLILVVLLKRPAISAYLIISVFFSYLATLGVTFTVFWAMDPAEFSGLDWKVPMFLFTILIAVGEDYNIFLMTRIEEEQAKHGTLEGISVALRKTGSIISSCGIIMAGTFASLLAGTLLGMHQLGFALAFGVLLDTFIVRPVLVPAYLVLLHSGRFGRFTKILGGEPTPTQPVEGPVQA